MSADRETEVRSTREHGRFSRRGFIDWVLGSSVVGLMISIVYPVVRYIFPPKVEEAAVNSVTLNVDPSGMAPNSGQIFKFGSRPGILVRTPAGELRAFSATCTHLDCTVQYRDDLEHIWCACHNGHYDLNGRNIAGPPPEPLEAYDVRLRGNTIVVNRKA
ncbi:MAG: ubiquinol-cytochrome c reductase iron-sulfur subunit [Gemmatimonadota bacterium]